MLQLQADNGYPKDLDAIMAKVKEQKYVTVVSKKKKMFVTVDPYILLQDMHDFFSVKQRKTQEKDPLWKSGTFLPVLCAY